MGQKLFQINKTNEGGYLKSDSQIVAGIAIIMMFFFHFFAYPDLQPTENCYYAPFKHLNTPVEEIIAPFGQLCVAIFAFNSGFIIAKLKQNYIHYKQNFIRGLKFLIGYWLVCLFFIVLSLTPFFYDIPDLKTLLLNLIGIDLSARANYMNVAHAWYVLYYITLLLLAPTLICIYSRTNLIQDIALYLLLVLVIPMLPLSIKSFLWPLSASIMGYMTFKYSLFVKCKNKLTKYINKPVCILLAAAFIFITFAMRHFLSQYNAWWRFDGIYSFLFIFSILLIIELIPSILKETLIFIGSIGMYLWFTHSIFAIGPTELKQILYVPYIPILIVAWGVLLCLIPSLAFNKIHFSR